MRVLVSHFGLRPWEVSKLTKLQTSVYMAIFSVATVITLVVTPISGYQDWLSLMAQPVVAAACSLFVIALLLHSWVGIRDVILDYVPSLTLRLMLLSLLGAWLILLGMWSVKILLRVTL